MVGRLLLIFLLTVLPVDGVLALSCDTDDEATCRATNGCEWKSELAPGRQCKKCDANSYCENGVSTLCSSATNGNFLNSETGAASVMFCYKTVTCDDNDSNVSGCKYYKGYLENNSNKVDCITEADAHMEGDACYMNNRNCSKMTSTACPSTGATGDATYNSDTQKWTVSDCTCTQNNAQLNDKHCIATKRYTASGTVSSVATPISYTLSNYYCTGCVDGYYVHPENGFMINTNCNADLVSGNNVVCQCDEVPTGYYKKCNSWNYPISNQFLCQPAACPAGKTTNGPGATVLTDCHFTSNTKFCDAGGCFTLGDISEIAPDDWQ